MTIAPGAGRDQRNRRLLLGLIGLIVSLAAIWLIARSVDLGAAWAALGHGNLVLLFPALGVLAVGFLIRLARWQRLLPQRQDQSAIPLVRILPVLLVGSMGNIVLPARLGEAVRAYLIARREGLHFGSAFGSVVLERIIDTATLSVLAFAAALAVRSPEWVVQGTGVLALVSLSVVLVLATTGLGPFLPFIRFVLARLPAGLRVVRLLPAIERFIEYSGGSHRRPVVLVAAILSVGAWLCDATMMWLVGQAFGLNLAPAEALLISAITSLSTAIPSAPGYVGTYELAAVSVATALGVASGPALAMAVVAHAVGIIPFALAGAASLALMGGNWRTLSQAAENERAQRMAER